MSEVFKFNYLDDDGDKESIYKFENDLVNHPKFGVFSND